MDVLILGAIAGVVALGFIASIGFAIERAVTVVLAFVRARQGHHRPTAAAWRMATDPRVRRTTPAWSHRRGRAA